MRKLFAPKQGKEKVVGEVRQSQLITSFGCGSIADFLYDTVIIAGTDKWDWAEDSPENKFIIYNENLQNLLGKKYFVKPKIDMRRKAFFMDKSKDIPAYRFPEILYCIKCHRLYHYSAFDHQTGREIRCFCGNRSLVPSRFVVVCEKGHIEDFPYSKWVHRGSECPKSESPKLSLLNIGNKSGISSLVVKCESCRAIRGMQGAFAENALVNIKKCEGNTPWLAEKVPYECNEPLKTRLRISTNVYFPVTISALSIPPWSKKIFMKLQGYYNVLSNLDFYAAQQIIKTLIQPKLPGYSMEDIMLAYNDLKKNKSLNGKKTQQDLYIDEYMALTKIETGNRNYDDGYSARFVEAPRAYKSLIKKVVAIDRLTEVVAMLGFTRLKPWSGRLDDERLAPLSLKEQNWLPAVQLNGEGIFIEFDIDKLKKWSKSIGDYYMPMKQNLDRSFFSNDRFSPQYVLLHTFSHLLIRQLSLECGYGAASLKEKIYSTFSKDTDAIPMAGVLIYTAAPDSDGSLGGLVELSDPDILGQLIYNMLESARWCSSDPLCITSYGKHGQGFESLNYAACHACTLLPETSCEFRNLLLDRAALIGSPEKTDLGIFN